MAETGEIVQKTVEQNMKELKAKLRERKVVLGTEGVIKKLRAGAIERVFLVRNCPEEIKKDILHFSTLANIQAGELELDNEELGVFCKKGFFVSVIGIVK